MCGITGIFAFNQIGKFNLINLAKATKCLTERGPDDEGMFLTDFVGLGHRRLSILDLSEKGHQPMKSPDGRFVLVYNGEIYNYKLLRQQLAGNGIDFISESDTEVLMHLLIKEGKDCLNKLNGFFAFAFFDQQENRMLLARDRYGIKPLYYQFDEDKMLFGSNLKTILALGIEKNLDFNSLHQYLQLNYIPAPDTIFKKVKKMLPGQYLEVSKKKIKKRFYYQLSRQKNTSSDSFEASSEKFKELLTESVEKRLVTDVPLGSFLSGGLDSSVISLLANQLKPGLCTFSIGYPDAPYFDETTYAEEMADYLKTRHTTFNISRKDLYDHIFSMLDEIDEPFADSSALPVYILSKKVREEVSVILSGDGADELLGGYNKYKAFFRSMRTSWKNQVIKNTGFFWDTLPASRNNLLANKVRQLRRYQKGLAYDLTGRYWFWLLLQAPEDAISLLDPDVAGLLETNEFEQRKIRLLSCLKQDQSMNGILGNDLSLVLANDMLFKVDSMSMAHGLEVRVPFLDHHLVDWAKGLPSDYKINEKGSKRILREAFKADLPARILKRPKHGFEVPLTEWFKKDLKGLIFDELLSPDFLRKQGIFREDIGGKLKKKLFSLNPGDVHANIWALVVFQWWWRKYLN